MWPAVPGRHSRTWVEEGGALGASLAGSWARLGLTPPGPVGLSLGMPALGTTHRSRGEAGQHRRPTLKGRGSGRTPGYTSTAGQRSYPVTTSLERVPGSLEGSREGAYPVGEAGGGLPGS